MALITTYILVDRLIEIILMLFCGMSVSYWNPIQYAFALACPMFTMLFTFSSKLTNSKDIKVTFFYVNYIALYIIALSMFMQWINSGILLGLVSLPNFSKIASDPDFSTIILRALRSISLMLPVTTGYAAFKALYTGVNETKPQIESIYDYKGIDLSDKSKGIGPYTCEIAICKDTQTGKIIKTPENKRFESMLVCGISGAGKTSMILEPMMARDLEKKFFFKETSKEMAFTALKTGIATLNCPYDNDYINSNFSLNMISPSSIKGKVYKAYMKKLIQYNDDENFVYKNLGFTYIAPDIETINRISNVANNFGIKANIIDPVGNSTIGLNPFVLKDPVDTAVSVSTVLEGMYAATSTDFDEAFKTNVARQAVENLCILLKLMYPRMHEGQLPTLEDLLRMLNDFDLVEKMCRLLELDEDLAQKYDIQINYFKKYFYKGSIAREETEKNVFAAITQIDNLLRYPGIKKILCNRTENLVYDDALSNGEITLLCTRRGEIGATENRAFGLFFILMMQHSVLKRPGKEDSRIPHFLYIDEFPTYVCGAVKSIFTLFRKYRVGTIISTQNLQLLGKYRDIILANCTTKIIFGGNTPEENKWWSDEFGKHREWTYSRDYNTSKGTSYEPTLKSIKYDWKSYFDPGKIQNAGFKTCFVKTRDIGGRPVIVEGKVDFIESKYKSAKSVKNFNFTKFTNGIGSNDLSSENKKEEKFDPKKVKFDNDHDAEIDPIQMNTTDSRYIFNNEDAIIVNLGKRNRNNTNVSNNNENNDAE